MKSIPIDRPIVLKPSARKIFHRLDDSGFLTYLVGGCVRDTLLSRQVADQDFATTASPNDVVNLFSGEYRVNEVGKSFGVILVDDVEIATFRKDVGIKDNRHPDHVEFSDPEADARRRDFTINALFYDPKTQKILDYVGGIEDLKQKKIRAVGDPIERFKEDALRVLRAIRFAAMLDFDIEIETLNAVIKTVAQKTWLMKLSHERLRDEMKKCLGIDRPSKALLLMHQIGLIELLYPELFDLSRIQQSPAEQPFDKTITVWDSTLAIVDGCRELGRDETKDRLAKEKSSKDNSTSDSEDLLVIAALFHECGKPMAFKQNQEKNFNNHEVIGGDVAKRILTKLSFSNHQVELISKAIEDQTKFRNIFSMREATIQRWIREPHFELALRLHQVRSRLTDGNSAHLLFAKSKWDEFCSNPRDVPKLITGDDLIHLGMTPGRLFAEILTECEDLAFEKKLLTKDDALRFVLSKWVH